MHNLILFVRATVIGGIVYMVVRGRYGNQWQEASLVARGYSLDRQNTPGA